jgi:hypothetical protein
MPLFGLELLDMARGVAAFNLPARVGAALRGKPVVGAWSRSCRNRILTNDRTKV